MNGQTRATMSLTAASPGRDALPERRPAVLGGRALGLDLVDPGLDETLELQAADHPAGRDGDDEPGRNIEEGGLPAEQSEEEDDGDLVDHRRGDQERERHTEGDAGFDEAQEKGDGRARTERRHDPQGAGHDVAGEEGLALEEPPGPLGREIGPDDADREDDQDEKHEDLGDLEKKEAQRLREAGSGGHLQEPENDQVREFLQMQVQNDPGGNR